MKKILFTLTIITLFSCNKTKESAQDVITGAMEKVVENKTGTQVDLPDTEDMDNNGGFINYKSESKTYLNGNERMQATVIFQKDNDGLSIALQLTGENGKSFIATLSHIPEHFSLPLNGKFAVSNRYDGTNPSAMIMFMDVTENGMMTSEVPYEGEITIIKLTKDIVEFKIDGKGGETSDIDSPSNWKAISGKGKITHPIILSYGIDKNNVLK
ncbi:hypothetical protein GOQ30_13480 [Flavobacterium sp. TP390]|uniref:Uncharacterized protein n=1 Tax=Flavobacterium profundi TaxID=1774945 RepID=A0A6I4ITU9_9FLAO|nr:hypothetical protein [Flavobacterium profundi]MVO10178.1 hypothetical protein [Flavobacterium profundi]